MGVQQIPRSQPSILNPPKELRKTDRLREHKDNHLQSFHNMSRSLEQSNLPASPPAGLKHRMLRFHRRRPSSKPRIGNLRAGRPKNTLGTGVRGAHYHIYIVGAVPCDNNTTLGVTSIASAIAARSIAVGGWWAVSGSRAGGRFNAATAAGFFPHPGLARQ